MPGVKKYSPPRTVTTRESGPTKHGWVAGDGHLARGGPSWRPISTSSSSPRCSPLPSLNHCACTNSNWRVMLACRHMKTTPRSWPSSSAPARQRVAVGDAAPDQAVAVDELALERQAVARVGAADVAAGGAAQPVLVVEVGEGVVARGVGDDGGVGAVGGEVERRAVAPAPDELGRQHAPRRPGSGARRRRACGGRSPRPGAACGRRGRSRWRSSWSGAGAARDRVLLVAVAEDELAGADRPPAAVLERRALAGQRVDAAALDRRLGEAVGEAEVLDPAGQRRARPGRRPR